jgi:hypothetical protein
VEVRSSTLTVKGIAMKTTVCAFLSIVGAACVADSYGVALMLRHQVPALSSSQQTPVRDRAGEQRETPVHRVSSESDLKVRTEEDRERAAFYNTPGPKLLEEGGIVATPGPEPLAKVPFPPDLAAAQAAPIDPLLVPTCKSDAVLVGRAEKQRVFLNAAETFLFTVSDITVQQWIRPTTGQDVVGVSMSGGDVFVGDRRVRAVPGMLKRLDRVSLLFLMRLPKTGALILTGDPLLVSDASSEKGEASRSINPAELRREEPALVKRVRALAARCGELK